MNDGTRSRRAHNFIDRTGQRYGKLTVIRRAENRPTSARRKDGRLYAPMVQWLCICDCGSERTVTANSLRNGNTRSCGCSRLPHLLGWRQRMGLPAGMAARNAVYKHYRVGAKARGLAWELTDEEFNDLTSQRCRYCDCPPSNMHRHGGENGHFVYNGIDRVDNTRGYTSDNVVPCCSTCNRAKNAMSYDEFMAWVVRLVRFQGQVEPRRRKDTPSGSRGRGMSVLNPGLELLF
jgi:hypothetical protein